MLSCLNFGKSQSKKLLLFIINTFFCFSFNFFFFYHTFSIDSLYTLYSPNQNVEGHLKNGRFFFALVVKISNKLHLNLVRHGNFLLAVLFLACGLLTTIITVRILAIHPNRNAPIKFLNIALINGSVLCIFNSVFTSELYYFKECSLMYTIAFCGSIGAALLACTIPECVALPKRIICLGIAAVLLAITVNTYQIHISLYMILSLTFLMIRFAKKPFLLLKKALFPILILPALGCGSNLALLKISTATQQIDLQSSRYQGLSKSLSSILPNLSTVLKGQGELWLSAQGMLPCGFFLAVFLLLFLLAVVSAVCISKKTFMCFVGCVFIGTISVFLPHIISGSTRLCQRTIFPIFALLVLFASVISLTDYGVVKLPALIAIAILLVISLYSTGRYSIDCIISNAKDQYYSEAIEAQIEAYEQNTGIKVSYVCFYQDAYPDSWNWDRHYTYDLCINGYYCTWNRTFLLKYYCNRDLSEILPRKEWQHFFSTQDWKTFVPNEQLIFQDESVMICLY